MDIFVSFTVLHARRDADGASSHGANYGGEPEGCHGAVKRFFKRTGSLVTIVARISLYMGSLSSENF